MESEEISSLTEKMLDELETLQLDGDKVVNRRQFDPGIQQSGGGRAFIDKIRTFSELHSHHPYGSSERVELALKDAKLPPNQVRNGRVPVDPRRNVAGLTYQRQTQQKPLSSVAYRPGLTSVSHAKVPTNGVSRKNPNYVRLFLFITDSRQFT